MQTKNSIEILIETDVITGTSAANWKKKAKKEKKKDKLIKKAERGDVKAMCTIACNCHNGKHGVPRNFQKVYQWHQKAHKEGHVRSTTNVAAVLLHGVGVAKMRWMVSCTVRWLPPMVPTMPLMYWERHRRVDSLAYNQQGGGYLLVADISQRKLLVPTHGWKCGKRCSEHFGWVDEPSEPWIGSHPS